MLFGDIVCVNPLNQEKNSQVRITKRFFAQSNPGGLDRRVKRSDKSLQEPVEKRLRRFNNLLNSPKILH